MQLFVVDNIFFACFFTKKGPEEGQEVGSGTDGGLHLCCHGYKRGASESITAAPSGNRSVGRRFCR